MTHKVVFEIEVSAMNKLEAAKLVRNWLTMSNTGFLFYVQDNHNMSIASIDLDEDDADAVTEVNKYLPMIKNK